MKANELRKGSVTEQGVVKTFCERGVHVGFGKCYEFSELTPTKATKEILNKIGFFIVETNGKFEATLPNFRYNIYWDKYTDGFLFCDGETVLINFNYVHELQNLVFVLGQRELTVA
jgi:hypothetical protein